MSETAVVAICVFGFLSVAVVVLGWAAVKAPLPPPRRDARMPTWTTKTYHRPRPDEPESDLPPDHREAQ